MTPRDTPGLIAYRVEVKLSDRWYLWGYSPNSHPETLKVGEFRSEPVWAIHHGLSEGDERSVPLEAPPLSTSLGADPLDPASRHGNESDP